MNAGSKVETQMSNLGKSLNERFSGLLTLFSTHVILTFAMSPQFCKMAILQIGSSGKSQFFVVICNLRLIQIRAHIMYMIRPPLTRHSARNINHFITFKELVHSFITRFDRAKKGLPKLRALETRVAGEERENRVSMSSSFE